MKNLYEKKPVLVAVLLLILCRAVTIPRRRELGTAAKLPHEPRESMARAFPRRAQILMG